MEQLLKPTPPIASRRVKVTQHSNTDHRHCTYAAHSSFHFVQWWRPEAESGLISAYQLHSSTFPSDTSTEDGDLFVDMRSLRQPTDVAKLRRLTEKPGEPSLNPVLMYTVLISQAVTRCEQVFLTRNWELKWGAKNSLVESERKEGVVFICLLVHLSS